MVQASDLCGYGFLPKELPPPFSSESFGALIQDAWEPTLRNSGQGRRVLHSLPMSYNLFRSGTLRREISIPNPLHFAKLSHWIEQNWDELDEVAGLSPWTFTRPSVCPTGSPRRAISANRTRRVFNLARMKKRVGARFMLKTDISRFYSSIYTHALEWAIHTKEEVKANRQLPRGQQRRLWGCDFDKKSRALNGDQSVGLAIGPDTSLLSSEILLSRVDQVLSGRIDCLGGVRYIDDYELYFASRASVEEGLATMQEVMAQYGLALNPSKTEIVDLPQPMEPEWVRRLRPLRIKPRGSGQRGDLINLFDASIDLVRMSPDGSYVLVYVLGMIDNIEVLPQNWTILESILLQIVILEPGTIRLVLRQFLKYRRLGRSLDLTRIGLALSEIVVGHGRQGHGSEVAWAIWVHISLGINIVEREALVIQAMEDSVVALLALDARRRGLFEHGISIDLWQGLMRPEGLYGSSWMLVYEAANKGWLRGEFLSDNPDYGYMSNRGVEFYRILNESDTIDESLLLPPPFGLAYPPIAIE